MARTGRPKVPGESVYVRLDTDIGERLNMYVKSLSEFKVSKNSVINAAIKTYLKTKETNGMDTIISFEDYEAACLSFAKATKDFGGLNDTDHYTTSTYGDAGYGGSVEKTSDNAHGGLNVRWAFRLTSAEIKKRIREEYVVASKEQAISE